MRAIGFTLKADFWKDKQRLWTFFTVIALLISFLVGIVYYWNERDSPEQEYVEIYVTDLPANFSRVDVVIAGVYVGADNNSLAVERPAFDLLSLRGPDGALRVAAGYVPRANHSEVRLVFQSVHVTLNGASLRLDLPDPVLVIGHPLGLGGTEGSAFLFDINLDQSIIVTDRGLAFRPVVDALYIHHYGGESTAVPGLPGADARPAFGDAPSQLPSRQAIEKVDPSPRSTNPFTSTLPPKPTSSSPKFSWNPPTTTTPPSTADPGPTTPPTTGPSDWLPAPGDVNSLPVDPGDIGGWFVRFVPDEEDQAAMAALVEAAGAQVIFMFGSEPAAYVFANASQARTLSELPNVVYVEADQAVVFNLQSSKQAIQLPSVQDLLFGLRDASGRPIDGRGVGAAVVDLGFDGTHPDLQHRILAPNDPVLLVNYKVESLFTVDLASTDQSSGHGTHVAGILAGRGLGDPTQRGVAYGSSLYGFAIGEVSTTLWPNIAFDWLVQNHAKVDPPIRVVSNSWGSGSAYDPNSLTTRLVERLVEAGVTVVFAAGNSGGDGSIAATTSQCQIPKEGVICVGAFDDNNLGQRNGQIAGYSSRGKLADPYSWPDLSAPGTNIRSARPLIGATTGFGVIPYETLSGTSMAAPHVAGVAALMVQANPDLSPAQIEAILEQTAYKFSDGGSYTASADARFNASHYAKGHGLLDAYAAVQLAQAS